MSYTAYQQELAERVWPHIKDPEQHLSKQVITRLVNARLRTKHRVTEAGLFSPAVRLLLEEKAAEVGLAVIIENGYCFTTTDTEAAERRAVKRLHYHATHGIRLNSPGNGVNLLRASDDEGHRLLAFEAEEAEFHALRAKNRLDPVMGAIAERNKERRREARRKLSA